MFPSLKKQSAIRPTQPSTATTTLAIAGMTCASCVRHVTSALKAVDGVSEVDVSLHPGSATVQHDRATASQDLIQAVELSGYSATEV
jgi:copper chaperone CopZ